MPAAEQELRRLEKESARPDFWDDAQAAQETMKRLAEVRQKVETWRGLEARLRELRELAELPGAEEDEALLADLRSEVEALGARLDQLEFELSFSGPYDGRSAILAIHAGAGGAESRTGRRCCCACTCAGPSAAATRPTSWT